MAQRSVFTWQHFSQSEEGGVICYEAGGEDQSCIFLVQLSELLLQRHMEITGARDVPGPTCTCTMSVQGIPEDKS